MRRLDQRNGSPFWIRPFRDNDNAELGAPAIAREQTFRNDLDVERNLGDENRIGAARDAGMERDPSRVAPHHLDDHDAMVRLSGRVQAIDRVGRECHGGVEAEAGGRADDIVVDRLGHADHGDAALTELLRDRQRAVAADDDDRVEPHLVEHLDDAIGIIVRALG